jgi:hypothetical protein
MLRVISATTETAIDPQKTLKPNRLIIARSSSPNDNCQLHLKTRFQRLKTCFHCFRSTYEDTGQNLYDAQFGYFK